MNLLVPNRINRKVRFLLDRIGIKNEPKYVSVIPENGARINQCFLNVQKKIEIDGGEMLIGWQIWETPIMIEAEFHAVWINNDNVLIDITPKQIPVDKILFVQDDKLTYNGKLIDNIRLNLTDNSVIDDYIKLQELRYKILNYKERAYKTNVTLTADENRTIQAIDEICNNLQFFCYDGNNQSSLCFCGSNKPYYNCDGKDVSYFINTIRKHYSD